MPNSQNVKEAFGTVNRELGLRSLLFALLFYVVGSPVVYKYLNRNSPYGFETLTFQALLFGIIFYIINMYL